MRTNMDPLTPATTTLAPAVSHIADTAATLSRELSAHIPPQMDADGRQKQRQTVRWVLDAPLRLSQYMSEGRTDAASRDWQEVKQLLEKWKGVQGVEAIWRECEDALRVRAEDDGA
jgi:vacuolar protein sorting-associated protein 51